MHEFSICQSIIRQSIAIASEQHAFSISRIKLGIGSLSGIDTRLLNTAFPIAATDTLAAQAILEIEHIPLLIHCPNCKINQEVSINKLCCPQCHSNQTRLISGDEMLISYIEIITEQQHNEESIHV